jgi:NTP pyrophosphatase (non-canonical NTP hydrolase)
MPNFDEPENYSSQVTTGVRFVNEPFDIDSYQENPMAFNQACQTFCMQPISETFSGYQLIADSFRKFDADSDYPWSGLVEEVGELFRVKSKLERGDYTLTPEEVQEKIRGEVGDVLWNLAALCTKYDVDFADAAVRNLNKLEERRKKGTLLSKPGEIDRQ